MSFLTFSLLQLQIFVLLSLLASKTHTKLDERKSKGAWNHQSNLSEDLVWYIIYFRFPLTFNALPTFLFLSEMNVKTDIDLSSNATSTANSSITVEGKQIQQRAKRPGSGQGRHAVLM